MDETCELQQIGILLTDNGFITILEEMTISVMPSIEVDDISVINFLMLVESGFWAV